MIIKLIRIHSKILITLIQLALLPTMIEVEPPFTKRQRTENPPHSLTTTSQQHTYATNENVTTMPTQRLYGHTGSIYAVGYSPDGQAMASGSFDKTILLWDCSNAYEEGYKNYNVLKGHKNAVLDLKWTPDSENVVSCGADKMCMVWDCYSGQRVRKLAGHEGIVNAIDVPREESGKNLICSASDDCTVKLWDSRQKREICSIDHKFQVTAVAFSNDGTSVYFGGLDNTIFAYDLRNMPDHDFTMRLKGHSDTITCLSVSPDGNFLLSNSMDGTMKTFDVRPFVGSNNNSRECKVFRGAKHNAEKGLLKCSWSADGNMVTGGSADTCVHIWDELTAEELYYLPGHNGCVNSVVFHPKDLVIASGSSDKTLFVGELSN